MRLEDQDTGLTERQVRRRRHPVGFRRAIILDVHRQDVLARLEVGREVKQIVVQPARLTADWATEDPLTVDEERIARVGSDAGRRAVWNLVKVDRFAEQAVGLWCLRIDTGRQGPTRLDRLFWHPDPMTLPPDLWEVVCCDCCRHE